ncbi:MAG: DUF4837 family protein [Bacteroidales bacterium]|jgi:hypothetical protein|nr:DUF4837 family protein [Bacteroidales bacterium]MDD3702176.1 DUF4837 family protein [Bacteroidales bacterium]MDY0368950.1 DUF4837 family protein [Bacteroidales bacterium]
MRSHHSLLIILLTVFIFSSCGEPEKRTARSVGATSEILVVSQNKEQWSGAQGEAVRRFFGQEQYGLPQSEPIYKLTQIEIAKLSDMFKKHRNLLIIENDPQLSEAVVETRSDLWAKPQRVIKITAPDTDTWVEAFETNQEAFRLLFDRSERERLLSIYRATANSSIMETISKKFGLSLLIPEGFYIAKNEDDFMWIRKEASDFSQAFIIYSNPYRDTAELSMQSIISRRDRIVQQYIPGPVEGSFMSTDKEFIIPQVKPISNFITDFAVETKGVWNVVGDYMAGPFLAYTLIHPTTGQMITLEGYVYAPNKPKRDYLRQLEAILYSTEFTQ